MASWWTIIASGVAAVVLLASVAVATPQRGDKPSQKHKRQLFREQVLPHAGGKIPSDAFRADRLALNRLNKDGIAVPDGVLLEARKHDKHPNVLPNSDLEMAVIKIVLTPDGRYVPREGASTDQNPRTVDSTYIIRPPIGIYRHEYRRFPKQKYHPIPAKLELPNKEVTQPTTNRIVPLKILTQPTTNHIDLTNLGFGFPTNYAFQNYGYFSDYMLPFYTPQTFSSFDSLFNNDFSISDGQLARSHSNRNRKRVRFPGDRSPEASNVIAQKYAPRSSPVSPVAAEALESFVCDSLASLRGNSYADSKSKCQTFHVCRKDGQHDTFECPKGTLFSEAQGRCDWWYNVTCR